MIRLSERMEHIVELAKPEESGSVFACSAEIGCDHAYITMEIIRRGYAKAGIAMDVKEGPLKRAAANIKTEFKDNSAGRTVDIRLSDGLIKLKEGESDLLVIAGMGGGLICRILEEGKQVSDSVPVWILQPQTECYELRKYLLGRNHLIEKEDMVLEDGKFYPMFRVVHKAYYGKSRGSKSDSQEKNTGEPDEMAIGEDIKLKYGPLLLEEKHPCLLKYLLWKENVNRELFSLLEHESSSKAVKRKKELENEYLEIQEVKEYVMW